MEKDESVPLLKDKTTSLIDVSTNKWPSSNNEHHVTMKRPSAAVNELAASSPTTDNITEYLSTKRHIVNKRADHPTTDFQTFIHLVKGNVGTGLLALPFAISKVGYLLGPVLLVVLGVMAVHSMILLVKCCQALCKQLDRTTLDYGEVVEETFRRLKFRDTVGKVAKAVINVFLIATQFGFCCVFLVFFGENLKQVFDACGLELPVRIWIVIMVPIVTVFTWVRNLDTLAPLSFVANISLVFGLGSILYYIANRMVEREAAIFHSDGIQAAILSMTGLPVFFGNALFTYEAIGMVLPIENKMMKPQHFNMVMYAAMTVVTCIYVIIATLGYLAFGNNIKDSITLNLPADKHPHSIIFHITKLLFCYSVFITFMIDFYVPMDFLELPIMRRLNVDETKPIKKNLFHIIFRSSISIIIAGFALSVPELDLYISLMGAFASSLLAIIFPPILEIMVFYNEPEPCWQKTLWIIKSLFILLVGLLGFATGTYISIKAIIEYFKDSINT